MALCDDFLKQARALSQRRGRPSQINLRRATSAAYYAVFHLLIQEASASAVPAQPAALRAKAPRSMQHGELREICRQFQDASRGHKLASSLGVAVPPELRILAKTFVDPQDERHAADYDVTLQLSQSAALSSVSNAEAAFRQWATIKGTDAGNVFLAALIVGKRWDR